MTDARVSVWSRRCHLCRADGRYRMIPTPLHRSHPSQKPLLHRRGGSTCPDGWRSRWHWCMSCVIRGARAYDSLTPTVSSVSRFDRSAGEVAKRAGALLYFVRVNGVRSQGSRTRGLPSNVVGAARPIIWEATFLKGGRQTGIQQRRNGERRMRKASMVEFGHGHALPYQGLGTRSLQEPLLHRRDGAKARPSIWEANRETVAGRQDSSSLFVLCQ